MDGAEKRSRLPVELASRAARPFAEVFTFDYLGAWWGDAEESALSVVRGAKDTLGVRRLFRLEVTGGDGREARRSRER
jgi:hypothetical protein